MKHASLARLASFVLATAALAACDDHAGPTINDPCGEPAYGGAASDEAWLSIVDAEKNTQADDAHAATIMAPAEGQVLPATSPPTFAWTSPLSAARLPDGKASGAHARPTPWWRRARSLFVGTAHAHLPPVTGTVHYLKIAIPGAACPVRAFTTLSSWTPDAAAWSKLTAAAGQTLTLEIVSAYLRDNRVTEGPYRPTAPRSFQIQ